MSSARSRDVSELSERCSERTYLVQLVEVAKDDSAIW